MKILNTILLFASLIISMSCENINISDKPKLKNGVDSLSYYLGIYTGFTLKEAGYTNFEKKEFESAVLEVFTKDSVDFTNFNKAKSIIDNYIITFREKQYAQILQDGRAFLAKNKKRKGIITTASGMQYKVLLEGTGVKPQVNDSIVVLYKGTTINGEVFLDKYKIPDTILFTGNLVGLREALLKMKTGSKYKVFLPSELAYGKNQIPGGIHKPNMAVIFEIELLAVFPQKHDNK